MARGAWARHPRTDHDHGDDHIRRVERAGQPAGASAPPARCSTGRRRGAPVLEPGRVRRGADGDPAVGASAHDRELAPHRRRGRLHRRRLRGERVRRGSSFRRRRPGRGRRSAASTGAPRSRRFDRRVRGLRRRGGGRARRRSRRPRARITDALHVRHDGTAERGVPRRGVPRDGGDARAAPHTATATSTS